ncbi:ATPase domain-containing protein [Paenibacillus pinistramenti]|uniref:ATPase domain-containing protein n=1 Tax=Paenibacillus pinistramenti TaxID=1768003 RepID=UPI0023B06699|nr:ATPase domain-containing protein [Paenibacillus pinistramenti]
MQTGIPGLDKILCGGVPRGTSVILEGEPGTGKTTFGMQFLVEGIRKEGEAGIYVTFEELPEQIYSDMAGFGWNLKELERQNMLRVITMEPEIFLQEMQRVGGIFEQMTAQINCKRLVIDSISLFRFLSRDGEARSQIFQIRNIVRKMSLTALLIREYCEIENLGRSFENYVCDGIIRLSLQPHLDKYRKRTLEVLKMRGTPILEGEHIYKFVDSGIHIVPALSMAEDVMIFNDQNQLLSTGIPSLDQMLDGGLPRGSVFIIDTNSKANYKYLVTSMLSERIRQEDGVIIMMSWLTSIETVSNTLSMFGLSLKEAVDKGNTFFIEQFDRKVPPEYRSAIISLTDLDNPSYEAGLYARVEEVIGLTKLKEKRWFIYFDLNSLISHRGIDFVKKHFAQEMSRCQSAGITAVAHCNLTEIGPENASYLERSCNGVIRTWVDGSYQFLQVAKSPSGRMTMPHIIENTGEKPYIRLL